MDAQENNIQQIKRTNQRGGRCLSATDLMEAGTISPEMGGLCWAMIEQGVPFLTGAVPGGAGKTTLMAALLAFLPPDETIITASDHATVERVTRNDPDTPVCLLAHEIGQGPWFAYIWGETAHLFFAAQGPMKRPVTCLHADTPEQSAGILRECGVSQQDISAIGLQLYIRAMGSYDPVRRVTSMHCHLNGHMTPVYRWDQGEDRFERLLDQQSIANGAAEGFDISPTRFLSNWRKYQDRLQEWKAAGTRDYRSVREEVLDTYISGS